MQFFDLLKRHGVKRIEAEGQAFDANRHQALTQVPGWDQLNGAALSSGPVVQLAVDVAGQLRVANAAAESLFNLRPRDLGRAFSELEVSFRPAELRSRIEHVRTELRSLDLRDVEYEMPTATMGTFTFNTTGTYLRNFFVRVFPNQPFYETAGIDGQGHPGNVAGLV